MLLRHSFLSAEVVHGGLSELGAECPFFRSILLHPPMMFLLKLACLEFFRDFRDWPPFCFWEEQIDENCCSDQDSNKDEEAKRTKNHLEIKTEQMSDFPGNTFPYRFLQILCLPYEMRNKFIFSVYSQGSRGCLNSREVFHMNDLHVPVITRNSRLWSSTRISSRFLSRPA